MKPTFLTRHHGKLKLLSDVRAYLRCRQRSRTIASSDLDVGASEYLRLFGKGGEMQVLYYYSYSDIGKAYHQISLPRSKPLSHRALSLDIDFREQNKHFLPPLDGGNVLSVEANAGHATWLHTAATVKWIIQKFCYSISLRLRPANLPDSSRLCIPGHRIGKQF